jgi:hypothetical protein
MSGLYYKWHDGQGWHELGFCSVNEMMTVLRDTGLLAKMGVPAKVETNLPSDAVVESGKVSFGSIDSVEKPQEPDKCFHNKFDPQLDRCPDCGKTSQELRDMQ